MAVLKKMHIFRRSNWKKSRLELWFFNCHNINVRLLWLILKRYTILEDFFLLDSVRYRDYVMMTLKFDWFNLKILMSGWYRKLTSSCVSFATYQEGHSNIVGATPVSLQYQNVQWANQHSSVLNSLFGNKLFRCIFHSRRWAYTAENDQIKYFVQN